MIHVRLPAIALALAFSGLALVAGRAEEGDQPAPQQAAAPQPPAPGEPSVPTAAPDKTEPPSDMVKGPDFGDPPGAIRLTPKFDVWMDKKRKLVIVDGEVCLREGHILEMFACPRGTKEYESIVAVNSKAFILHAALLSIGAEAGTPVKFTPEYAPATGTPVDVFLLWYDKEGKKQTARAQQWVRDGKTKGAMQHDWVFVGSSFWTDETTGEKYYQAEGGELICVSNFPTAMLDLPIESTQDNQNLLFEPFTENIPPVGTKVRLVLHPRLKEAKQEDKPPAEANAKESGKTPTEENAPRKNPSPSGRGAGVRATPE